MLTVVSRTAHSCQQICPQLSAELSTAVSNHQSPIFAVQIMQSESGGTACCHYELSLHNSLLATNGMLPAT